jgi:hypothetical protein
LGYTKINLNNRIYGSIAQRENIMSIMQGLTENFGEKTGTQILRSVDRYIRYVMLKRALESGDTSELPYSLLGYLEDPECNRVATMRMWANNAHDPEYIDEDICAFCDEVGAEKTSKCVDRIFCTLKWFCESPVANRKELKEFDTLIGQFAEEDGQVSFKLSSQVAAEILNQAEDFYQKEIAAFDKCCHMS